MRRAKRDMTQRAYKQGRIQGQKGHQKDECPYSIQEKRGQWLGGWRIGRAEYLSGCRSATEF
jgi:ribosome modulation factor